MNRRLFLAGSLAALVPVPALAAVQNATTRQSDLVGTVLPTICGHASAYFFVAGTFLYADGSHLPYGTATVRWQGQTFTGGLLASGFAVEVFTTPLPRGAYQVQVELAATPEYAACRAVGTLTVS